MEQESYHHISLLNEDKKKSILQLLKTFAVDEQVSERIILEQYNRELEESERQIDAGHFTTQEDLEKEMETR